MAQRLFRRRLIQHISTSAFLALLCLTFASCAVLSSAPKHNISQPSVSYKLQSSEWFVWQYNPLKVYKHKKDSVFAMPMRDCVANKSRNAKLFKKHLIGKIRSMFIGLKKLNINWIGKRADLWRSPFLVEASFLLDGKAVNLALLSFAEPNCIVTVFVWKVGKDPTSKNTLLERLNEFYSNIFKS